MQDLLNAMNSLLEQGLKVSEAEKQLGYSDGQARKLLSKAGFKCDRKLNKYVPKNDIVTDSNAVTQPSTITDSDTVTQAPEVTRSNTITTEKPIFTGEQIEILHKIIQEYQVKQRIQADLDEDKGKTINRNIRVYEKQFEKFATWCKENNVTQADALYKAIGLLMDSLK